MKIFKQHTIREKQIDKLSGWIANILLTTQEKFTSTLTSITKKWKRKQQMVFLITFSGIFLGWSTVTMVCSFYAPLSPAMFSKEAIKIRVYKELQNPKAMITEKEFLKVKEYKRSQPKLSETDPRLYNGLTLIEEEYYLQNK